MSLNSFNPFDLLDEDGGDRPRKMPPKPKPATDAPKPQQQQAAPQAKTAPAKNAPAGGAAQSAGKKENDAKAKPQGDAQRPRGTGKEGAGKRSPGQPRQQQQQQHQGGAPAAPREGGAFNSSENAADKPRERRDRDHRTHDRPNNARGRQYDRRSGTGRPANENKRGGSGKGNWGTIEEGQEAEQAPKVEGEGEKEENPAPAEGGEAAPAEPPKEAEKEYLTLDEYMANKKTKPTLAGVEAPKLRAAGEGVDTSAWADYAPLEKSEDDGAPSKKKKDAKKVPANGKDGKDEKVSVDKLFRVTMTPHEGSESRRGGRGGKGGPGFNKGGGGRGRQPQAPGGAQRPGDRRAKGDASVALADQSQFPSLGGEATTTPVQSAPAPVKA